jgi:translation initiation factor 2B subunit (eIF-2B alpha/beta/delta family)
MTWSDWPGKRRIESLLGNTELGEAETGSLIATELAALAESVHAYDPDAFEDAVASVVGTAISLRPTSAPILSLANSIYLALGRDPETTIAEIRSIAERLRSSVDILGVMGAAFVPDGGSVLAHGTSSTVRRTLEEANRSKRFRVTCGVGLDGAGRYFASDLASIGVTVELVNDDVLVDSLFGVDLLVTGASAFGPDSLINTTGTDLLVKEATNLDLRVLLIAAADKALPAPLFDRAAAAASVTDGLEVLSLRHFESVVTELGVLDPGAAGRLASGREVAAELL